MDEGLSSATYTLELRVAASPSRVWQALTSGSAVWWPRDFYTSERTPRMVIEPELGGRMYEDFGGGDGLVWYSVVGIETGRELHLAGHLLPPFGGPAVTALRISLSGEGEGTLVRIRDDRCGVLGGPSPLDGWRHVFESGLKAYLEAGSTSPFALDEDPVST